MQIAGWVRDRQRTAGSSTCNRSRAMLNPSTPVMTTHMIVAAYMATGFTVAAVYAVGMLKGRRDAYHRRGLAVGLVLGLALAPVQIVVGDAGGALGGGSAAGEARRDGRAVANDRGRAPHDRRDPAAVAESGRSSDRGSREVSRGWPTATPGAVVHGAGRGAAGRPPERRRRCTSPSRSWWRSGSPSPRSGCGRRSGGSAAGRLPDTEVVPPSGCRCRTGDLRRPRDGLGGDRGRSSTVHRLRPNADGGRRDIATRIAFWLVATVAIYVLLGVACAWLLSPPRADATRAAGARGAGMTTFQLEVAILIAIGGGLTLYWLLGERTSAAGCGISLATGPMRERERALISGCDRTGLGSEPRLVDLRGHRIARGLPGRVRVARLRAVRAVLDRDRRDRVPRGGVRVPFVRRSGIGVATDVDEGVRCRLDRDAARARRRRGAVASGGSASPDRPSSLRSGAHGPARCRS